MALIAALWSALLGDAELLAMAQGTLEVAP